MFLQVLQRQGIASPHCLYRATILRCASSSSSSNSNSKAGEQGGSSIKNSDASASMPGSWVDREQASDKHWLDRAFPGARQWLEQRNRAWMIHNTTAAARRHAHLQGRETEIARLTESAFQDLLSRHIRKAVDDRGQTHVENACLLLASHKVLLSFIRNNQEVLNALRAQAGARSSAVLHYLLRFSMLFQRDPYECSVRRLKALRLDLGKGFQTEVMTDGRSAELVVHKCLYRDILQEEDALQLLECCCCSQDSVWFEGLERQRIEFTRQEWLGSSDKCCRLYLRQL